MAETPLHKQRVAGLLDYLRRQGVAVTHAVGSTQLSDPHSVGRHEPDAIGRLGRTVWIGEAKTGEGDLFTEHTLEQLYDFSHQVMTGTHLACPFVLCVPKTVVNDAHAALRSAGADLNRTTVIA